MMRSGGMNKSNQSFDKASIQSGKKSDGKNVTVNFAIGGPKASIAESTTGGGGGQTAYGIPTLKMLNPELYKEMEKQEKQMKDPIFVSMRNLRERYGYHEIRA